MLSALNNSTTVPLFILEAARSWAKVTESVCWCISTCSRASILIISIWLQMKPGDRQPKRLGCSRLELKAVSTSGSITSFWDMADVQHSVFKSWCKFYEVVKWRTQHGWTQTTVMQLGVQWNWILHSIIAARESSEALFEGALWSSSFVSDKEAGVVF